MVRLGEVVDFYSGGTPSKANSAYWAGDVPWFSAKDMKRLRLTKSQDRVSEAVFSKTPLRRLPAGTVAVVVRGMILNHTVPISILDVDSAINQDLKALLPRCELDPTFLAAMLRAQHGHLLALVSTAAHGTKKLDSRVLEQIQIPLPPIEEQRRIAAILDQAEMLRAKRREALALLDDLTHSIFHDMFGDPTRGNELRPLSHLAEIQIGPFGSLLHKEDYVVGGIPLINPMHIVDGSLRPDPAYAVSANKRDSLKTYALRADDVVMGRRGEMGRCAIVSASHEGMLCGTGSLIIRPRGQVATAPYLQAALSRPSTKALLESKSLGATLPNLNATIVKELRIAAPALDRQAAFAERVGHVQAIRLSMSRQGVALAQQFAGLQAWAFSGRL